MLLIAASKGVNTQDWRSHQSQLLEQDLAYYYTEHPCQAYSAVDKALAVEKCPLVTAVKMRFGSY